MFLKSHAKQLPPKAGESGDMTQTLPLATKVEVLLPEPVNPSGYLDPRAEALVATAQDWCLLLQLGSEKQAGMMWGDVGCLYFWMRKLDLAEHKFGRVWMVLQCS